MWSVMGGLVRMWTRVEVQTDDLQVWVGWQEDVGRGHEEEGRGDDIAALEGGEAEGRQNEVLLGDMGTGKTSLVLRFVKGQFFEHQEPTIGAAFFTQILSLSEATVKFDIWDTAGQERYHSLAPMYYRGAAAALVVYDIASMDTFARAKKWVQELKRQGNPNLVMALVANKCDLEPSREVETEEGLQYSQDNDMFFIEASAKAALNVNELFYEIGKFAFLCFIEKLWYNLQRQLDKFHLLT
ncbi:hypothetical protein RJ639_037788 [Escallonia herrerae]|uniref:Ras-related protein RHN1-like n=1 Tax=Escallonia herrerae TaxID=1293975 RepID=A0AA88WI53_9ASTE|nr:hypothetical protein RJ639_037788 [Escallonia herrerae]